MKYWLLVWLCVALILAVCNTTKGASGDTMKAIMCISICAAICFVWVN